MVPCWSKESQNHARTCIDGFSKRGEDMMYKLWAQEAGLPDLRAAFNEHASVF